MILDMYFTLLIVIINIFITAAIVSIYSQKKLHNIIDTFQTETNERFAYEIKDIMFKCGDLELKLDRFEIKLRKIPKMDMRHYLHVLENKINLLEAKIESRADKSKLPTT